MMDDMSENAKSEQYQEKTGRESNPIGVAAVILLLCICFLIDARVGFGALIGAAAGFFAWSLLKDNGTRKEENADDRVAFLDTTVLQHNFPLPQNMPIPYAVLDIRGHILMYNEKFAKEFPNMELILPVVDQAEKGGDWQACCGCSGGKALRCHAEPVRGGRGKRRSRQCVEYDAGGYFQAV